MKTNEMHPAAPCGAAEPGRAVRRALRPLAMAFALAAAAAGCSKGKQQDRTQNGSVESPIEWRCPSTVQIEIPK